MISTCLFFQNTLYYDTWWVGQHVCLTWLSTFLMLVSHFLSPRYLDLLHRSALHLGRWQRVEGRHVHVPYSAQVSFCLLVFCRRGYLPSGEPALYQNVQ